MDQIEEFDAERARLTGIAVRILGSETDADDVLQEAWLRYARAQQVDDLPAWLTTVVTRLCLDQLRKRGTRSVAESGALITSFPIDQESDALMAERVAGAMTVVLDTLAPAERAAFVLHDVFGYPFDEVSAILGRSTTAVRQLASRARRKVEGKPELAVEKVGRTDRHRVVDAFLKAANGGDLSTLMALLAPDAIMRADLVGQKMGTEPAYEGAEAVAGRFNGAQGAAPVVIDGELSAAWIAAGQVRVAFVFHVEAGLISEVELIADKEVLATMDFVPVEDDAQMETQ
jgi:RNA polymerase sigma factor (sigma-70 family)